MKKPSPLRVYAEDVKGLQIISSAMQDGVAKMCDLVFEKKRRRFTIEMNRFNWEYGTNRGPNFRTRSVFGIDSVLHIRARNLPTKKSDVIVSLLAIVFTSAEEEPAGKVVLQFSNDGEIELDVECIDLSLLDTDKSWPTLKRPQHKTDSKKASK